MPFDRQTFFDTVRGSLFHNRLTTHEVIGMEAVMDAFAAEKLTDLRWLAAILAEIYGEVGSPMWPIHEGGEGRGHPYGKPGAHGGQIPFGRGFDQCTWDANYEKTDVDLGLNGALLANYDLLLDPKTSARAIVTGMVSGRYRRFKLADYLNDHLTDWVHCRLIINPDKRGPELALKAVDFYAALLAGARKAGDASAVVVSKPAPAPVPAPAPAPYTPSPPVIATATKAPAPPPAAQDPLSAILAQVTAGLGSIIAPTASGPSPAPASVPSATNESAPMTDPATTAAPQSAASIPVLGTVLDFLRGVSGKLEAAHTMTTSGSNIATGVIASLPEIPTIVGEISTLVVDVETGAWGLVPTAVVAIVEEFEKIAGKFGLDMSKLDAFVRSLPFQPPVAKAA